MKTKLVQHVESEWMRDWKSDQVIERSSDRAIFGYKQRLLSIEMKTKLVQHVESDWMRDWKSVRVRKSEIARESESEKVWGWVLSIEMKTKVVQHVKSDWMRDWMSVRVRKSEIVRESESVIWFPAFVWRSDIFSWEPALWTQMSQGADADDDDVKKKPLQFSAINSDFWA